MRCWTVQKFPHRKVTPNWVGSPPPSHIHRESQKAAAGLACILPGAPWLKELLVELTKVWKLLWDTFCPDSLPLYHHYHHIIKRYKENKALSTNPGRCQRQQKRDDIVQSQHTARRATSSAIALYSFTIHFEFLAAIAALYLTWSVSDWLSECHFRICTQTE